MSKQREKPIKSRNFRLSMGERASKKISLCLSMGEQAEKAHKIKVFSLLVHLSNPSMRIKGVKE